jgi:hypothetical protein
VVTPWCLPGTETLKTTLVIDVAWMRLLGPSWLLSVAECQPSGGWSWAPMIRPFGAYLDDQAEFSVAIVPVA